MEVITIESKAFKQIIEKLDALSDYVNSLKRPVVDVSDDWVDSREVCEFLKISNRTLQRLRSAGKIAYSCIGGKYYYQISHIKTLLRERIIKSTDECLQALADHHRQGCIKKR